MGKAPRSTISRKWGGRLRRWLNGNKTPVAQKVESLEGLPCGATSHADRPTVIVVTHNATRTGAPMVALEVVRRLSGEMNVVTLAMDGGELLEHFQTHSVAGYCLSTKMPAQKIERMIDGILTEHQPGAIVINSMASRAAFERLQNSVRPTLMLVHELAHKLRDPLEVVHMAGWVDRIILSTEMAAEQAFGTDRSVWPDNHRILPQGQCEVPPQSVDGEAYAAESAWLRERMGADGRVQVMGMGSLILTKGVDMFLEMTRQLREMGADVDCVWFGKPMGAYDGYLNHLKSQCQISGLDGDAIFAGTTGQPGLAQELADVFVLPSRSDTLPNVAIDAMMAGRPVVCFAGASGIAPIIAAAGQAEHCLAQPFDPGDLARKVQTFARDAALRRRVGLALQAHAKPIFDRDLYLDAIAEEVRKLLAKAVGAAH